MIILIAFSIGALIVSCTLLSKLSEKEAECRSLNGKLGTALIKITSAEAKIKALSAQIEAMGEEQKHRDEGRSPQPQPQPQIESQRANVEQDADSPGSRKPTFRLLAGGASTKKKPTGSKAFTNPKTSRGGAGDGAVNCWKHPNYDGHTNPNLRCKACCTIFVENIKSKNKDRATAVGEWLESSKRR